MCLPFGALFAKFGIAIGGFSSETKEPKLHKLGVFWANYCKKHPIWSKLGAFLSKMVYWWVGNLAKNWYRDSQIFEVRQAHPRTILVKEPPPPPRGAAWAKFVIFSYWPKMTFGTYSVSLQTKLSAVKRWMERLVCMFVLFLYEVPLTCLTKIIIIIFFLRT